MPPRTTPVARDDAATVLRTPGPEVVSAPSRNPWWGVAVLAAASVLLLAVFLDSTFSAPWSAFLPIIVISAVLHRPAEHVVVIAVTLGCVALAGLFADAGVVGPLGALGAGSVISGVTMWRVLDRARVEPRGHARDLMLDDLRVGVSRRSRLPRLCPGWSVDGCVRPAEGQPFSGDFIVSHHDVAGRRFEAALVDVSGKGLRAASLAVQLSGALDALIGTLPPEDFLTAANEYVVRQEWEEGFATAIHLSVDLDTGEFTVYRAGHPPAARYRGDTGAWSIVENHAGPALGLLSGATYLCDRGVLDPQDAVLLYSDGLVERHDHALDDGILRLVDYADDLVAGDLTGIAGRLCEGAPAGRADDRGVIVLQRG